VLSIDEMVCFLTGSQQIKENALNLAAKIKCEINNQYKYIRCLIGIAPNIFLAKTASNIQKPDGCVVTEDTDIPQKLYSLPLRAFNGIGGQMEAKLRRHGIDKVKSSILKIEPSYAPFGGVLRVSAITTNCVA